MFHKISTVDVSDDFVLEVRFAEGICKSYDVKQLFGKIKAFDVLKNDPKLFEDVAVDVGGYGIVWNDELDLSCDELWDNGVMIATPFDGLLSFAEASRIWKLNESTLRKAVNYGKFVVGVDACKFGKQWVVSVEAMQREYGQMPEWQG